MKKRKSKSNNNREADLIKALRAIATSRTKDADYLKDIAEQTLKSTYGLKSVGHLTGSKKKQRNKKTLATNKDKQIREQKLKQLEQNESNPARKKLSANDKLPVKAKKKSSKKKIAPRVLPAMGQSKKPGSHRNQA